MALRVKVIAVMACLGAAKGFVNPLTLPAVVQRGMSALTMAATRTPIIAGNWKENPSTLKESNALCEAVADSAAKHPNVEVAVFPPFPFIYSALQIASLGECAIGAQNCYFEDKGAYTGAVATTMLESMGCKFVLCGHSERRSVFRNDDTAIQRKVRAVLNHNLVPILCVGETKSEYDAGLVKAVCAIQLAKDLKGVSREDMMKVVIAYEPVWAIGTGLTATPETAQAVHSYIRSFIAKMYDQEVADTVRIQYGGSVTPETVDELMRQPDVDGALVGGAALDGAKFGRIIGFKS